jgi:hypothetical protein
MKRDATILSILFLFSALLVSIHGDQGTRLTSGAFTFASGLGEIHAAGQSGFRIDARVDITSGVYDPESHCAELDCQPGTELSLLAHWVGQGVGGSATLRGQDYVLGMEGEGGGMAIVTFDGSVILPDFNSSRTAVVTAPFTFTGQLESETTFEVEPLSGSGVATLQLSEAAEGQAWRVTAATYQFAKRSAQGLE